MFTDRYEANVEGVVPEGLTKWKELTPLKEVSIVLTYGGIEGSNIKTFQ